MSPTTVVFFICFILSLQNVGADSDEEVELSEDDYYGAIVSFWKIHSRNEFRIICLGALISSKWIFVTHKCYRDVQPYSETYTLFGSSYSNLFTSNPYVHIVDHQEIRPKSRFIILILELDIQLTSPLKVLYEITPDKEVFRGKLLGWKEMVRPVIEDFNLSYKTRVLSIAAEYQYRNKNFPEGSLVVKGKKVIGLTYYDSKNFTQIYKVCLADELKLEILLEAENESNGSCKNKKTVISNCDYYNSIVSFRRKDSVKKEVFCAGALIDSKRIFTTVRCSLDVLPYDKTIVSIGGYYVQNNNLECRIIGTEEIRTQSKFIILLLDRDIQLPLNIKVGVKLNYNYEANPVKFVGWNEKRGPVAKDLYYGEKSKIWIENGDAKYGLSHFPPSSLVIIDTKIVAATYADGYKYSFLKVAFEDLVGVEVLLRNAIKMGKTHMENFEVGSSSKTVQL